MPLTMDNDFLPDIKGIKPHVLKSAKMMFLNYPNNPTAATCEKSFFKDIIKIASRENIIVCHDAAYTEISFDGYKPPSFLEVEGAREVGVEFHSLSKTFNMTGWRVGFACGNAQIIKGLAKVKSNVDSGIFTAIQLAAVEALKQYGSNIENIRSVYQERVDCLVENLEAAGLDVRKPKATFYVWMPILKNYTSITFAKLLLEKASVVVTPGNGFGKSGEGYVRFAITVDKSRLKEAADRIARVLA
jgi:LL-diaminopimelate aminotransferase